MGVTEILCSFKLVLEGKAGKEIPESSRLEFTEKFSANNFILSDAAHNTSIENTISSFPVMETFVLLPYASLAASRTFLQ